MREHPLPCRPIPIPCSNPWPRMFLRGLLLIHPALMGLFACTVEDADGDGQAGDAVGEVSDLEVLPGNLDAEGDPQDADGDGYPKDVDCNDRAPDVHPGGEEHCDFQDNDCDGEVDEAGSYQAWYRDRDGDGYGNRHEPTWVCRPGPGYSPMQTTDCDDTDARIHPDNRDLCDGIDNNCSGSIDEDFLAISYPDRDHDGFGDASQPVVGCRKPLHYMTRIGDCDDTRRSVHAGAEDPPGDGIDQDCGGTTGPDPHVGLNERSVWWIQDALDAAGPGQTVWVGPRTYSERELTFRGRDLILASTEGSATTRIDAGYDGRVFVFDGGETPAAILRGFRLFNGKSDEPGAGIYISHSSPTLEDVVVGYNTTTSHGGGIYLEAADVVMTRCQIFENRARRKEEILADGMVVEVRGGGIYLRDATLTLRRCLLRDNAATADILAGASVEARAYGGGLYLEDAHLNLEQSVFEDNGTYAYAEAADLANSVSRGGAAYLSGSSMIVHHTRFQAHEVAAGSKAAEGASEGAGGAFYLAGSSLTMTSSVISRSEARGGACDTCDGIDLTGQGGALFLRGTTASLEGAVLVDNRAETRFNGLREAQGGGLYLDGSELSIRHTILASNTGHNLYTTGSIPSITWSDLYDRDGENSHNLPGLEASNRSVDPRFLEYDFYGEAADFHLAKDSPLIDAGDPGVTDGDGSRADPGVYGGAAGDGWDLDQDGFPAWFWPGTITDVPPGVDRDLFDETDASATWH